MDSLSRWQRRIRLWRARSRVDDVLAVAVGLVLLLWVVRLVVYGLALAGVVAS